MSKTYFSKRSIRKLIEDASPGPVSSETVDYFISMLNIVGQKVAVDGRRMAHHAGRKTMTPEDALLAAEKHVISRF
jgi:histone H3/H4